jgi:hypothetical protein
MTHRSPAGLSGSFARSPVFSAGLGSALRAPDLFILACDFFLTLSHRFLKLSDLLA